MGVGQTTQHLAVYNASIAASGSNVSVAAVNDQILTLVNGHFVVPDISNLAALFVLGPNIQKARINTPSLRYVGLPYGNQTNNATPYVNPYVINDFSQSGVVLPKIDEIAVEVTNASGSTAETATVGMLLQIGSMSAAVGPQYCLHGTAAITGVSGAWANGTLSLDQTLPSGRYQVQALDVVGANIAFARLIFPGASYRPGVVARQAFSDKIDPIFLNGYLGPLGAFDSINLPNLEIFCTGANTAQDVFLTLVRTGNSS